MSAEEQPSPESGEEEEETGEEEEDSEEEEDVPLADWEKETCPVRATSAALTRADRIAFEVAARARAAANRRRPSRSARANARRVEASIPPRRAEASIPPRRILARPLPAAHFDQHRPATHGRRIDFNPEVTVESFEMWFREAYGKVPGF